MNNNKNWKYYLGIIFLIYSFIPYLFISLVLPFLDITDTEMVTITTTLIISAEVSFLSSVSLLGKPFVIYLKSKLKSFFLRKKVVAEPKPVGKIRFYTGLTLFFLSLIIPYYFVELALFFNYVDKLGATNLILMMVSGDFLFIISLFILGSDFWENLNKLFIWPGYGEPAKIDIERNSNNIMVD